MAMTYDVTSFIQLLWRRVVVGLRIHEKPCCQALDFHCDIERRLGLHNVEVLRGLESRSGHVFGGRDRAHRNWVTRSRLDLFAVGNLLIGPDAEIDEVIGSCQRGDLIGLG